LPEPMNTHDVDSKGQSSVTTESFYRLRRAGLMAGDSERNVRLRCQLNATYLEKRLL
jgi:hypothetical protein